jgi:hypothetical protein
MRDRLWILSGLVAFVVIVTLPFWSTRGAKSSSKEPALVLPANSKQCVAPAAVMRAQHMRLLISWREDVVRRGDRRYVAFDGKVYDKSLTRTCLGCHNKEQFCDRCHVYVGVSEPYCWNCHHEPQTNIARSAP